MSKKIIVLIAVGGTGGHVFPGLNLAKDLAEKDYDIELITDRRGFNFLKNINNFKISILILLPFIKKNILTFFSSLIVILYSIIRSILFLIIKRPKIIFGMGGYASFPVCIAAYILRIKFIIYENNLIIGKANKHLLPFTEKIFVSNNELEGIPKKYNNKILRTGNIIKKEIIHFPRNIIKSKKVDKLYILVLGGSQVAKVFAEKLPYIFEECSKRGILLRFFNIACLIKMSN